MEVDIKGKCHEILASTLVASVSPPSKIFVIPSNASLTDSFKVLLNNNILSAPVQDVDTKEYVGFLDVRDLISFVCHVYDHNRHFKNFQELISHGVDCFKSSEEDGVTITYLSRRNKFHPVEPSDTLLRVAQYLSHTDVHRVPVVKDGQVVNIISQSTIIQLVSGHLQNEIVGRVGPLVDECNVGTYKDLVSLSQDASVIEAFKGMDKRKFSGIALTDETGRLVGVTTGKDLGLFLKNAEVAVLNQPIGTYLKYLRSLSEPALVPSVAVFGKSKFSYMLGLLASTRVHRVFVADNEESYRPVGVISITDLLRYISD